MSDMSKRKEYVDPILIEEGFFSGEEDYVQLMDEVIHKLGENSGKLTKVKTHPQTISKPTRGKGSKTYSKRKGSKN